VGLRYVGGRRALLWGNDWSMAAGNLKAGQGLKLVGRCDELGPWICNSCGTSSDEPCLCELKQSHVISLIRPENAASRRVAEVRRETGRNNRNLWQAVVYGLVEKTGKQYRRG